jgi:hypothetical protein
LVRSASATNPHDEVTRLEDLYRQVADAQAVFPHALDNRLTAR